MVDALIVVGGGLLLDVDVADAVPPPPPPPPVPAVLPDDTLVLPAFVDAAAELFLLEDMLPLLCFYCSAIPSSRSSASVELLTTTTTAQSRVGCTPTTIYYIDTGSLSSAVATFQFRILHSTVVGGC